MPQVRWQYLDIFGTGQERLFAGLWDNSDAADSRLARRVLAGRYTWLEDGVLDPSIPGPWIAPARPGPATAENVHRHVG